MNLIPLLGRRNGVHSPPSSVSRPPIRVVSFGSDHPFTREMLGLVGGLEYVDHVDHIRTFDGRKFLQQPDADAARAFLSELKADLFLSAGYGRILTDRLLSIPRIGAINVHPSLLPDYRGYGAVAWALYEGRRTVGITVHEMTPEVDRGPILVQRAIEITPDELPGEVYERLTPLVGTVLEQALEMIWRERRIRATPQLVAGSQHGRARRERELLGIDFTLPAGELVRRSRIFSGEVNVPVSSRLRVLRMIDVGPTTATPGTILKRGLRSMDIAAGDGRRVRVWFADGMRAQLLLSLARAAREESPH